MCDEGDLVLCECCVVVRQCDLMCDEITYGFGV